MKMKLINGLVIILLMTTFSYAQTSPIKNDVDFVIGIEGNYGYRNINEKGYRESSQVYAYGLNFNYPINKFSIGLGVLRTNYGRVKFREYTGASFKHEEEDQLIDLFLYVEETFELNYLTISNRIQYRFPCNCIFIHGGLNLDFPEMNKEKRRSINHTREKPSVQKENVQLRDVNTVINFGLGFKIHITNTLRVVMRQSYNIIGEFSNSKLAVNKNKFNYLDISLGIQKGIIFSGSSE